MSYERPGPISIERLQAGDEPAFVALVHQSSPQLLAVARRYLKSEEDARDAVQETFVSAFRSIAGFRNGCRLQTWLYRITVNHCLMRLRSRRRRPEESIDERVAGHRELARASLTPAHHLELKQRRAIVHDAIARLPESYRSVLRLRDIEEVDTQEAARRLGISPSIVKVRLHRARKALRALLEPHFKPRRLEAA